jgi:hypothetical protein
MGSTEISDLQCCSYPENQGRKKGLNYRARFRNVLCKAGIAYVVVLLYLLPAAEVFSEIDRITSERNSRNTKLNLLKDVVGEEEYEKAMSSKKYRFTGNNKCRLCHRAFFLGRKKDAHAHNFKKLMKHPEDQNNPGCLVCHTTGYGVPGGFSSLSKTPRFKEVQCEGCHGPGSLHAEMDSKGGLLIGQDRPGRMKKACSFCHTKRWNRSFKNLDEAFKAYKKAESSRAKGYLEQ